MGFRRMNPSRKHFYMVEILLKGFSTSFFIPHMSFDIFPHIPVIPEVIVLHIFPMKNGQVCPLTYRSLFLTTTENIVRNLQSNGSIRGTAYHCVRTH